LGLSGAAISEALVPVPNILDETFVMPIYVTRAVYEMYALLDTEMAYTVLETATCSGCAAKKVTTTGPPVGMTVSATAATGTFNNPVTTYSGTEGTTTFCIQASSTFGTAPEASTIAGVPCIVAANVHLADAVPTPNTVATAYLGVALGKGPDANGKTPASTDLIMNQLETAGKLTAAAKMFSMNLI
jgi:hypothetical protein